MPPAAAVAQMEKHGEHEMKGMGMMGGDGEHDRGKKKKDKHDQDHDMGMGMGMGMDAGMGEMMKLMKKAAHLDLNPDQKKRFQALKLSHQKEAIPLFSQVMMNNVEIQELLLQDPVDIRKIQNKVMEKYDAMAKLEMSHIALKQHILEILTPEQREKLDSMQGMKGHDD
jgi:Spy/CpxP family protein refolding chaperone